MRDVRAVERPCSESAVAAGVRRIEGVTAARAMDPELGIKVLQMLGN